MTQHLLGQNTCYKCIKCKTVSMERLWNWHSIGTAVHRCTLTGSSSPTVLYPIGTGGSFPRGKANVARALTFIWFVCFWRKSPQVCQDPLIHEVSKSHTTTHYHRCDSSGRVISPTQRPLPDNTQHSQHTDIHDPGGIRTHNPSKRAAADLHLRRRSHWDRYFYLLQRLRMSDVIPTCTSMA